MRRAWRISDSATRPCLHARSSIATPPYSFTFIRQTNWHPDSPSVSTSTDASTSATATSASATSAPATSAPATSAPATSASIGLQSFIGLFLEKFNYRDDYDRVKDMRVRVTILRKDLVMNAEDPGAISRFLDSTALPLLRSYPHYAYIELLDQLLSSSSPLLALEVLTWRRKQAENSLAMTSEEYAKGIQAAGRCKNLDLAVYLFTEAANEGLKNTQTYNALMGAYMYNHQYLECQELFRDLKRDGTCKPSIVTYNILISVFGTSMLVNHMQTAFKEIEAQNLSPNVITYNNLIEGYMIAFMWQSMERAFQKMKANLVQPSIKTYTLMLRGYANSRNIEKMEEMYELVQSYDTEKLIPLIRLMITAYCWSSVNNRVEKIEALLRLIPENEYRPWLNVMLIRLYAQEDRLEKMEKYISEAFERGTCIHTVGIMRSIIGSYYRCNAADKLSDFVRLAESAGWKICRSLFHSKLVMYGNANRLEEMEGVLREMENANYAITKKTYIILYKAYSNYGKRSKVDQVMGLMCKNGYGIPLDSSF